MSTVTAIPPAPAAEALAHFEAALRFETDCWDVHDAMSRGRPISCCWTCAAPSSIAGVMCPVR